MILGSTLRTTFSTAKPLTAGTMNSSAAPVAVVYRNGALLLPAAPPVIANLTPGRYSLTYALTAANGHAANDWVSITVTTVLDGAAITTAVWEGNLVYAGADINLVLGLTIYPIATTHRPWNGANANEDIDLLPGGGFVARVYRNLAFVSMVLGVLTPVPGVNLLPVAITAANGWAVGDKIDIDASTTIDDINCREWVFSGGLVVAAGGGGAVIQAVPHYEVMGQIFRYE